MKDLRSTIPTNFDKSYPVRDVDEITTIIVHHSYTKTGSAEAYARFHIKEYDWPGIAYHYVIDKDGTVNKTLDHHKVGYHCRGMNRRSIGICLTGNYDIQDVPPAQFDALLALILNLREKHGWAVGFHNEYSDKTCPGWRFPTRLLLQKIEDAETPPPPPEDEHEPDVPMPEEEPPTEPDKPIVTPPPVNDGRDNPGCLAFLIF